MELNAVNIAGDKERPGWQCNLTAVVVSSFNNCLSALCAIYLKVVFFFCFTLAFLEENYNWRGEI